MRRRSGTWLVLAVLAPFLETAVLAVLPPPLPGTPLSPALTLSAALLFSPVGAAAAALAAAAWRDVALVLPYAPTLVGAALTLAVVLVVRRTVARWSAAVRSVTAGLAYGGYLVGLAATSAFAQRFSLASSDLPPPGALILGLGLTVIVAALLLPGSSERRSSSP
jgi:hypothetical protein